MIIRPVTLEDLPAVHKLAEAAGFGMTSLPADEQVLQDKVEKAVASFAGDPSRKGKEIFLFVMEDPDSGEVVGTTGIKAHVGLNQPFYSYKLTTITQQCKELDIFSKHEMLQVTNDLTGVSEIGSLFLLPEYRRDRLGRLLSLFRFLFVADFSDYFADSIIAEMRGVSDRNGNSPFYDSLAKHFFEMEFYKADYINATRGNEFINDLMPRYPIYLSLLPNAAREVIGQAHPHSVPAKAMLEKEGFRYQGYVDIFDGGPTLQVDKTAIRTARESQTVVIDSVKDIIDDKKYMISNQKFTDCRACADRLQLSDDGSASITKKRRNGSRYKSAILSVSASIKHKTGYRPLAIVSDSIAHGQ